MREQQDHKINYIEDLVRDKFEDSIGKNIVHALKQDKLFGINIGLLEVQILNFLIQTLSIKKIVEVGTLYGYSAYQMAKALPSDGKLWSVEKDPKNHQMAQSLLKGSEHFSKIELIEGDAQHVLYDLMPHAPFDMVFIDANKAAYGKYLDWAKDALKTGGIVVGDNSFLFGSVYSKPEQSHKMSLKNIEVMKEFNSHLVQSKYFETMILPTPEGLTVGVKK